MSKSFTPLRASSARPPVPDFHPASNIKEAISVPGFFAIGAVAQALLYVAINLTGLPSYLALLPVLFVIGTGAIDTIWAIARPNDPLRNPWMAGVLPGRTTAQVPDLTSAFNVPSGPHPSSAASQWFSGGDAPGEPASQGLVVFHFGVRINHPLGWLAPDAREMRNHFLKIAASINSNDEGYDRYGLMGMSTYRGNDRDINNTLLLVMYFRDVEGLHRLAHDPAHMEAWRWLGKRSGKHLSAFHETFVVEPAAYEMVYLDCEPKLLGAAAVKRMNEEGKTEWVHTTIDANHPKMKSMMGRMNREELV